MPILGEKEPVLLAKLPNHPGLGLEIDQLFVSECHQIRLVGWD
jgi:hypothetical protein